MPRLIDYVGRFEFIRQAAFAVVLHDGVEALSRRRVARELGTGVNTIRRSVAGWADLARLAADHVESRRRRGRWNRRTDDPIEAAALAVQSLMPEDESHLDEELVWLKLVAACALRPSGLEQPGELSREFGIGQRGYDDGLSGGVAAAPNGEQEKETERAAVESRSAALSRYVEKRDEQLRVGVARALDLVGVPEPREDVAATVIALVEGLTLSACLGRITAEHATRLAVDHVTGLRALPVGAPSADRSPTPG
jgi:hypothetical protein